MTKPDPAKVYIFTKSGSRVRIIERCKMRYNGFELVKVARVDTGKEMIVPVRALREEKEPAMTPEAVREESRRAAERLEVEIERLESLAALKALGVEIGGEDADQRTD